MIRERVVSQASGAQILERHRLEKLSVLVEGKDPQRSSKIRTSQAEFTQVEW